VAVLIELANLICKSLLLDRCVVFVTFAGEEAEKKVRSITLPMRSSIP
jgi:hypothetical protein